MEYTPLSQNISEDSGIATTSDKSSSASDATSSINHYVETPVTVPYSSRKRKLSHNLLSYESPVIFEHHLNNENNFLSSTLNESLTKSLEKCNLGNYTPNYISEHRTSEYDSEQSLKKYKLDDSPKYQPKTRSAPSTPTKHLDEDEPNLTGKCLSEQLAGYYFTPNIKPYSYVEKLGMQERFSLLYPRIQPTPSPTKLKTPEKLRDFLKKVNSPAKKRLFENGQSERVTFKNRDQDPIALFTVKTNLRHIVSKIFEYLSERDLCSVSKVSKIWKRALTADHKAFPRYYVYAQNFSSNKENILKELAHKKFESPPMSPERDSFQKCRKIVSRLTPNQSLQKCPQCMEPAVIQRNISQCQNPNCEYIYCTYCLSFSTTGPETFMDKCHMSELLINGKQNSTNRFGLYDISNGSPAPSFFLNESYATPQLKYDSSGYLSENDMSPIVKRNVSLNMEIKPLQPVQMNKAESSVRRKSRRTSLVTVSSVRSTPVILENSEPSSPPKIKLVACSKQSKKNLKRLHF